VLFLSSGVMKLTRTSEQLVAAGQGYAEVYSPGVVKTIGILEILAAVGLVLPAALGVAEVFVPLAAVGLALLMAAAFAFHVRRRETQGLAVTAVLFALAAVVAVGRLAG
jgi:hypothetical protein